MATKFALSTALILIVINVCLCGAYGDYGGGWIDAHATFYGGGDASGTMGKSICKLYGEGDR